MTVQVQEVQWSDLQRDPKGVAALADKGDVRVKRRDGADLLLTREDRVAVTGEAAFATARALRNVLAHSSTEVVAEAMVEEFPWLATLPDDEIVQFVRDFVRAAQAAAELGRWRPVATTIREWKATAAIHADPELLHRLSAPITEDHGPVPPPIVEE